MSDTSIRPTRLHGFQTALRVFVLGFQPNLRLLVRRTIFSGSLGFVGYKYPTYAGFRRHQIVRR